MRLFRDRKYSLLAFICFFLCATCVHTPDYAGNDESKEPPVFLPESGGAVPVLTEGEDWSEEKPSEPEAPPPTAFTRAQMDARIANLVYPGTLPVTRNGTFVALYMDLDGNGYGDACVLCIEGDDPSAARYEVLSDQTRLYLGVPDPFSCSIQFFLQKNGKLYRSGIAPLGRKLVLETFLPLRLGDDPDLPSGAVGTFKTRGGTEQEWALFLSPGISRITVHESLSMFPVIHDINGDGVVDIVLHQQGFEEGSGYETFLVWYKWNGKDFIEYRSTNIVRNLNAFLERSSEILRAGDWKLFLKKALDPKERERLTEEGLSVQDILGKIFLREKDEYDEGVLFSDDNGGFAEVVFPGFYETPFSYKDVNRFEIPLQVRFVTGDYRTVLCSATLYMKRNPFENEQFSFVVQ